MPNTLPPGDELNARVARILGWGKPRRGRSKPQKYSQNPTLALNLVGIFLKSGYQVSIEPANGLIEAHAYADRNGDWAGVAYAKGATIPHALALLTLEMWEGKPGA